MRDVKPLFEWAKQNGDANIYDRILMKVMPQLLKEKIELTSENIESSNVIEVPDELYTLLLSKTQELVGKDYV
jgi:hypothetical protein